MMGFSDVFRRFISFFQVGPFLLVPESLNVEKCGEDGQLFFHVHSLFFFRLIMAFRYWLLGMPSF